MTDLNGKVAIVTGAAGGIGSATVALLLERGARVLAVDSADAGLAELSAAHSDDAPATHRAASCSPLRSKVLAR